MFLCGCGGGSTGSSPTGTGTNPPAPPPPASTSPDFSLVVTPGSLTIPSGSEGGFQIAIQPSGGFTGAVQVQIGNLPQNTTLTPSAAFPLTSSSTQQTMEIATADNMASGTYSIQITGTSGKLTHSVVLDLTIQLSKPLPSRADFVRTDDTPAGAVYDAAHKVVYVTEPVLNKVDLISSETYQLLKSISIPAPAGIDITPDGTTVYVGTDTQAIYAIDTATQTVLQQYIVPVQTFPGNTLTEINVPIRPVTLSNGLLLFILNNQLVTWNPQTNTFTPVPGLSSFYTPSVVSRSANGTKVIISNDDEPSTVYVYDVAANSLQGPIVFQGFAAGLAVNPDGTQFAVDVYGGFSQYNGIFILDSNLKTLTQLPDGGSLLYSVDGKTLYVAGFLGDVPVIDLLDTTSLQFVGTAPSYASGIADFTRVPPYQQETPLAADETGRIFGSADHGLAIDDATDIRAYTGNEIFAPPLVANPDEGPVGRTNRVQLVDQQYASAPNVWFGALWSPNISISESNLSTTAPASSQVGPVNVRLNGSDQVQEFLPQAYTYGAELVQGPDLAAPASGQATINLYGYGLDRSANGTTQVSISAGAATIKEDNSVDSEISYPFSLDHLAIEPPAMDSGAYDITASSSAGSSTLKAGYHALDINTYAVDSQPYAMAYDKRRNQVYLSTSDHVDVFSLASDRFLAPFQVPTINHLKMLAGLALTPNGDYLLVSNWADGSVAVIDPDDPASATAIAVTPAPSLTLAREGPNAISATNAGTVLINVGDPPTITNPPTNKRQPWAATKKARPHSFAASNPYPPALWQLDLSTMTVKPFTGLLSNQTFLVDLYMSSSDDGTYVCLTGENQRLTLYDAAAGTSVSVPNLGQLQNPAECAIGGSTIATGSSQNFNSLSAEVFYQAPPQTFDLGLNVRALGTETDYRNSDEREYSVLTGIAVDPTGAIFYQPLASGVTLFDSHTGEDRENISLAGTVQNLSNGSLIRDDTGNRLFVVTSSGFTTIQLDALPIAIGSISASGGSWTITGTGFTANTTLTIDGTAISTQFVDPQHLQISGAPNLNQAHTLTLTNADGHSYTYAAAFFR